jgi:hypothetical protein
MKPAALLRESKAAARGTGRKQIRVTGSGCLDVCPSKGTAMAIVLDGADAHCVVVKELVPDSLAGMLS